MGTRLLFYLVLYPLSILPLPFLYGIAYIFYLIIQYIIKYRKKIIIRNFKNAFPEKNDKEIERLTRRYYHHLAQIAAEMLKMLTMSKKSLRKRYSCINPEVVNQFFEKGKSVILISNHYNNWEWMILSLSMQYKHHGVGVGKANSNKIFEKLINRARTRYGTEVVFADHVRETFQQYEQNGQKVAYMMLSDQSPNNIDKSYKTMFLNQPSAMIYGAEYFAKKYNIPVIYYAVIKDRMGYYHIENKIITDSPQNMKEGEIIEKYIQLSEQTITENPEFWLWSHRRWKLPVTIEQANMHTR